MTHVGAAEGCEALILIAPIAAFGSSYKVQGRSEFSRCARDSNWRDDGT